MRRPLAVATRTLALLSALLWVVAAGIVAFVCYVSGLDRRRDVAVLKSIGVPDVAAGRRRRARGRPARGRSRPGSPSSPPWCWSRVPAAGRVTVAQCAAALGVAVVIGVLAAAASVRQVVTTDPALAFAST